MSAENKNFLKAKLKKLKIILVSHDCLLVGPNSFLRDYLNDNQVNQLLYITHPLLLIKESHKESSRYELYSQGHLIKNHLAIHWQFSEPLLYVKDFIYTILWTTKNSWRSDLYIGLDPLNALAGLILKQLGLTKKVIYYSIDYFPNRFQNKLLNQIYHTTDKVCVRFCDETWNVSSSMVSAREKNNNMDPKTYKRQYTVPIGVWFVKAKRKDFADIDKKKIIYIGSLLPTMGIDLIIESMPIIIKKIPDIQLEIIGGGPEGKKLKLLAKKLKIKHFIKFYGWVRNRQKVEELLSDGAIGLATFNPNIPGDEVRNADPAKVKDYLLLGMPVIVTDIFSSCQEMKKAGCVIVVNYDKEEIASWVIKLLLNHKLLLKYRKNAIKFIEQYDWGKIYFTNLVRILS